ncbi:MAG TPA: hypothetical protein DD490_21780 [Acidobacteria bacterium]|nr:hypothetical protein [Acidobacteriota bacterium]
MGAWEALGANMRARLAGFPQLEGTLDELDALILESKELQARQDVYRRQLRELTAQSRNLERRGTSLRNKLVAGAQSVYGVESQQMVEFGVNPRLPKKRPRLTREQREKLEAAEKVLAAASGSPDALAKQ